MILLGVDTVGREGGVSLLVDDRAPISRDLGDRGRHAEAILPATLELLAEAGLAWEALSRIVVDEGPGSFTGLRVGIAFALGLGESRGIPVLGVGSLDILARACYDATHLPTGGYIVSVMDVRRGEVVRGDYRVADTGLEPVDEAALVPVTGPGADPPSGAFLVGDGLDGLWPDRTDLWRRSPSGIERSAAAAHLGREFHGTPAPPVPRYARPADARPRRG
jgi:tRNA threonylcarbamoyladenosine biosynthesis protein TsaB